MEKRPDFETLVSYEEFKKYYWYRKELSGICRKLGIEYRGTKQELNHHIEEYFCGKLAERKDVPRLSKKVSDIELHTPLLDCGFSFNAFFREYFAKQTGTRPFKFTADMAAAWRKVKKEEDRLFTMQDMLDVYRGKSDYAKYDASVCEWNRFVKDFFRQRRRKASPILKHPRRIKVMSNSISLPFLIMATGTILFVYMSVVIMELRSAYEESFWKQALKIGGIIFTLITLLFLGLDFVLTRFREKAFLLAPGMPILGIILVYMRSIVLAWRWRKRNPSHALIRMKRRGGFLKAVGAVILSVDGVPIQKSKAAVVVGKSVYILPGEHRLEMAGYTLRHQLSNIPSFPSKGKQQERTVRFTGGRRYILRYEPAGRKLEISDNGPI